jgi:hypothetical protein
MAIDISCPISGEQRDNNTVRFVAGFTTIIAIAALLVANMVDTLPAAVITGLLAIDFIIRAFFKPKYSPLATLARGTTSALNLDKVMVDSAPKVFAARIGVLFSVTSTILFALGLQLPGSIVLDILIVCAFLESVLSFCLGCWFYALLPKKVGNVLSKSFTSNEIASQNDNNVL